MWKRLLAAGCILAVLGVSGWAALGLFWPQARISEASCDLIQPGMPRHAVEGLLGGPPGAYTADGKDWSMGMLENGVRGIDHTREVWVGEDGGIRVDFDEHGRLAVSKWGPRHGSLWERVRGWV